MRTSVVSSCRYTPMYPFPVSPPGVSAFAFSFVLCLVFSFANAAPDAPATAITAIAAHTQGAALFLFPVCLLITSLLASKSLRGPGDTVRSRRRRGIVRRRKAVSSGPWRRFQEGAFERASRRRLAITRPVATGTQKGWRNGMVPKKALIQIETAESAQ